MAAVAAAAFGVPAASIVFADGTVARRRRGHDVRGGWPNWRTGAGVAVVHRILQHAEDPLRHRRPIEGRPFYYFAYGAALSEVEVDTLTGEYRLRRVDILHDAGQSLNPAIDLGQVEGGFVQGMGWLTTEELWWDDKGHLRTHAPSTYKIPACGDIPAAFNVSLFKAAAQQGGRDLPLESRRGAAADAGDRGVPRAARRGRRVR